MQVCSPADAMINKESQSKQNAQPVLTTNGGCTMTHKEPIYPHGFSIREYTPDQRKKKIQVHLKNTTSSPSMSHIDSNTLKYDTFTRAATYR